MRSGIVIVVVCLCPGTVMAEAELELAFKGGVTAARFNKGFRVNSYGPSGGVAASLRWPLGDRLSLAGQMDLLYTPRGGAVVVGGVTEGKIRQHYLDVVVAVRPEVRLGPTGLYLLLGGGLNLLTSANDENAAGVPRDVTDDVHRADAMLFVGSGVSLRVPRRARGSFHFASVFLEAHHGRGLRDVDTMNFGFKNRATSVMVGVSFALGIVGGTAVE